MDENALLSDADDPETVCIERVMPAKLRSYERYVTERSIGMDLKIELATVKAIMWSLWLDCRLRNRPRGDRFFEETLMLRQFAVK
jgi:hypothetical protein